MFAEGVNESRPSAVDGEMQAYMGQQVCLVCHRQTLGYGQARSPDPLVSRKRQGSCHTHRLCDPLAEDGQQEEGGDGRGQVAGDSLDVVEELPAVGALDDGDPEDADGDQEDHKQPAGRAQGTVRGARGGTGMGRGEGDAKEPGRAEGGERMGTDSESARRLDMPRFWKCRLLKSENIRIPESKKHRILELGVFEAMPPTCSSGRNPHLSRHHPPQ